MVTDCAPDLGTLQTLMPTLSMSALRNGLCLARRLWVMGGISIVFEHLRDDGTSD